MILRYKLLLGIAMTFVTAVPPIAVEAHDRTRPVVAGDLKIEKIWGKETLTSADAGAGYVMITNNGQTPDRLIGVETPISASTESRVTGDEDSTSTMQVLADGIVIPSGARDVLRPGTGHPHLMFMTLNGPIKGGKPFAATLIFEKIGKMDVKFRTVAIGKSPAHARH